MKYFYLLLFLSVTACGGGEASSLQSTNIGVIDSAQPTTETDDSTAESSESSEATSETNSEQNTATDSSTDDSNSAENTATDDSSTDPQPTEDTTGNDGAASEDTNQSQATGTATVESNDAQDTHENQQANENESNVYRIVTWNIEHLAEINNTGCYPRDDSEYNELQTFAETIEADIVGLQEVESVGAIHRVFPADKWDAVLSNRSHNGGYTCRGNGKRSTAQKVGFAIRKGVNYSHSPADNFSDLAINNSGLRYGVVIHLTDTQPATQVMSIHMKSGCFVDDYRQSNRSACETFSRQVPVLEEWMEDRAMDEIPYVVVGDYNHRLAKANNYLAQQLKDNPVLEGLKNLTQDTVGCHPKYPDPIDHIVAGSIVSAKYVEDSVVVHGYGKPAGQLKESEMLSDHCPISVDISL